jgi:hypothetical protein
MLLESIYRCKAALGEITMPNVRVIENTVLRALASHLDVLSRLNHTEKNQEAKNTIFGCYNLIRGIIPGGSAKNGQHSLKESLAKITPNPTNVFRANVQSFFIPVAPTQARKEDNVVLETDYVPGSTK